MSISTAKRQFKDITTPVGTCGHMSLFKTRPNKFKDGRLEYFVTHGFTQQELSTPTGRRFLADLAQQGDVLCDTKQYATAWRTDVDGKLWRPGTAGFFRAWSGVDFRPSIWRPSDVEGGKPVGMTEDPDGIWYPGCRARCTFRVISYNFKGRRGIMLSLQSMLWVGDGERLRRSSDGSEYTNLSDDLDDDDPTA